MHFSPSCLFKPVTTGFSSTYTSRGYRNLLFSCWNIFARCKNAEIFHHNEIQNIEVVPPKANFSQRLRAALKSQKEDPNIIIAKADKGDAVVILDSDHYYDLAAKHLADSRTYELLETDPSEEIVWRYHQYLERCVGDKILDDYQYSRLKVPSDYQLWTIYFLLKIHKHPLKLRPIVASFNSITTNASRFMNQILQPYMRQVRSYCKTPRIL